MGESHKQFYLIGGYINSICFISNRKQFINKSAGEKEHKTVLDYVLSCLELPENRNTADLTRLWAGLVVLPHIR